MSAWSTNCEKNNVEIFFYLEWDPKSSLLGGKCFKTKLLSIS